MSGMGDAAAMGYMGNYGRKLRKSYDGAADGAGLAPSEKFAGRATPLKGKGCPPPDMKEAEYKPSKSFVKGSSFKDNDVLITSKPVTAEDTSFQPSKKFLPNSSFKGNLSGTAAQVSVEVPQYRRSRSFSAASPDNSIQATSARVLASPRDEGQPEPSPRSCIKATIPIPKPPGMISPREPKLSSERVPAPTNAKVDLKASTQSFDAATNDYSKNKYRGQGSAITFG